MKTESKSFPEIKKLQGNKILLPCNTQEVTKETEDNNIETFYIFDQIELNQNQFPTLNQIKNIFIKKLNEDMKENYIFIHYDGDTQNTIQSFAQKAERLGRTDIVDECEKIFDGISDVLYYYDTVKEQIKNEKSKDNILNINGDFGNNVPKPSDLLGGREIKKMFNN